MKRKAPDFDPSQQPTLPHLHLTKHVPIEPPAPPSFCPWNELLQEMQREVVSRLTPYEHLSLSLTSKAHYDRFRLRLDPFALCAIVITGFKTGANYQKNLRAGFLDKIQYPGYPNAFFEVVYFMAFGETPDPAAYNIFYIGETRDAILLDACNVGSLDAIKTITRYPTFYMKSNLYVKVLVHAALGKHQHILDYLKDQYSKDESDDPPYVLDIIPDLLQQLWKPELLDCAACLTYFSAVDTPESIVKCFIIDDLCKTADFTLAEWRIQDSKSLQDGLSVYESVYSDMKGLNKRPWSEQVAILEFMHGHSLLNKNSVLAKLITVNTTEDQLTQLCKFGLTCYSALTWWRIVKKCHADRVLTFLQMYGAELIQYVGADSNLHMVSYHLYETAWKRELFDVLLWFQSKGLPYNPESKAGAFLAWAKTRRLKPKNSRKGDDG